ncbi:hypothetical protein BDW74DRAFT_155479 [Aspergillus multicolor]|uniref:uncharacterized protein n=1 Tax=Aspergillus multicolor TaxID=41759 RepID=UPI003CCCB298
MQVHNASIQADAVKQVQLCLDTCKLALQKLESKLGKIKDRAPSSTLGKIERHARRSLYPFRGSTLKRLSEIVDEARQNLHLALSAINFQSALEMTTKIDDITTGVKDIERTLLKTALHRDLQDWLNASDPYPTYHAAARKRAAGTGKWFTENALRTWCTTAGSFYWLAGLPGCGKTVLAATIVTAMFCLPQAADERHPVLIWFFDFQYAKNRSTEAMIRSLISQLCAYNEEVRRALEPLFQECLSGGRAASLEELLQCFKTMMQSRSLQAVYIIIDALDECPDADLLLQTLDEIRSWGDLKLHLLATSRPEKTLQSSLRKLSPSVVEIQTSAVDVDIEIHVKSQMTIDTWWQQWSPNIQRAVTLHLSRKATGMFRWVDCQLKELRSCLSAQMVIQCLKALPKDLDATYVRMLENIHHAYREYAAKAFRWISFSQSPITLGELNDVLATNTGDLPRFHPEFRFLNVSDLEALCPGLLITREEYSEDPSTRFNLQRKRRVVRFAHFSVKEFLCSDRLPKHVSRYYLNSQQSHHDIAKTCITYHVSPRVVNQPYPLAGYASRYLGYHWSILTDQSALVDVYETAYHLFDMHNNTKAEPTKVHSKDTDSSSELELDDEVACLLEAELAFAPVDQKANLESYEDRCEENIRLEEEEAPSSQLDTPLRKALAARENDLAGMLLGKDHVYEVEERMYGQSSMSLLEIVVRFSALQLIPIVSTRCLPLQSYSTTPFNTQFDEHLLKSLCRVYDLLSSAIPEEHTLAEQIRDTLSRTQIPPSMRATRHSTADMLQIACRSGDKALIEDIRRAYPEKWQSLFTQEDVIGKSAREYAAEASLAVPNVDEHSWMRGHGPGLLPRSRTM